MKKVRISLAAMALIMGIGAAFATSSQSEQLEGWFGIDENSQMIPLNDAPSTEECDGTEPVCAERYENDQLQETVEGGPYIGN